MPIFLKWKKEREILDFNILTMPDTGGGADELQIGTNNVLLYDPIANHMPKYIAPDSSPANLHTD